MLTIQEVISGSATSGGLWEVAGLSALAAFVSAIIISFMYAWGILFRNPSLSAYAKAEIYELIISCILVVLIIASISSLSSLSVQNFLPKDLLPSSIKPDTNIFQSAWDYYSEVSTEMESWINLNYVLSMYVDQLAAMTVHSRPMGVGMITSPIAGFASPLKQLIYNSTTALSIAMIVNYAQQIVYVYATFAFLKYYLPLGFFLRCFTPTRRIGGGLIGIGLAFIFVFPALSSITYAIFFGAAGGPLITFRSLITDYVSGAITDASGKSFSDKISFLYDNIIGKNDPSLVDLVTGPISAAGDLMQGLVGSFFLVLFIFPVSIVSFSFAIGFVIPIFNIMIFTQAAKGLSRSFGEDMDVTSLTRLI